MSKLFIVLSGSYWDYEYWASRHYVTKYLSKIPGNRVAFIEHSVVFSDLYLKTKKKRRFLFPGVRHISPSLAVHSLLPKGPWERVHPIFDNFNQKLIKRQIERIIAKSRCDEACLISFDYKASYLFRNMDRKVKKIYYIVDDTCEFDYFQKQKEVIFREENETIRRADLVIATSQPLLDRVKSLNRNVHLLSHGVDLEVFLGNDEFTIPQDLMPISKPTVGFVGIISAWVNLELVFEIAALVPGVSFVMVGPVSNSYQRPKGIDNVYFLGPKDKKFISSYCVNFDIGIIPFKENKLVKSVNPLKLLEYLAAGLPVISTPMSAMRGLEDLDVYLESKAEGFKNRIRNILNNKIKTKNIQKRVQFARNNSWEFKVKTLVDIIDSID